MPRSEAPRVCANSVKIIADKRKVLARLQKQKREMLEKIEELKRCSRTVDSLELCESNIRGYEWSKVEVSTSLNGSEETIVGHCDKPLYAFKFYVTIQVAEIVKLKVIAGQKSGLKEVQETLNILAEDCSSHLLLAVIREFIHLDTFRRSLISATASSRTDIFKVRSPDYSRDENGKMFWSVTVHQRNCAMIEITWNIVWDESRQSLTHRIEAPNLPIPSQVGWHRKLLTITQATIAFTARTESSLKDWWHEMFHDICSV